MKPAVKAGLAVGAFNFTINAVITQIWALLTLMMCCPMPILVWLLWFAMGGIAGWLTVTFAKTPLAKPGQQGLIAGVIVAGAGLLGAIANLAFATLMTTMFSVDNVDFDINWFRELFSGSHDEVLGVIFLIVVGTIAFVIFTGLFGGATILASTLMAKYKHTQRYATVSVPTAAQLLPELELDNPE